MQTLKVARTFIWKTKEKHDAVYHSAKIQTEIEQKPYNS